MSEGASYQSGRDPKVRNPLSELSSSQVVKLEQIPRGYTTGGQAVKISKGDYVYPKSGLSVFFFEDSVGLRRITKSKNQVNDPMRTGSELVGSATGVVMTGINGTFIQVDWVNSYVDHNLLKADERINEQRSGWVDASKVTWQSSVQNEGDGGTSTYEPPLTTSSGIDTTTLGYAAVAGALIFGMNKKKRK